MVNLPGKNDGFFDAAGSQKLETSMGFDALVREQNMFFDAKMFGATLRVGAFSKARGLRPTWLPAARWFSHSAWGTIAVKFMSRAALMPMQRDECFWQLRCRSYIAGGFEHVDLKIPKICDGWLIDLRISQGLNPPTLWGRIPTERGIGRFGRQGAVGDMAFQLEVARCGNQLDVQ